MKNSPNNAQGLLSASISLSVAEMPEINPAKLRKSKDAWVPWGKRNRYPDELLEASKKATIHQSFIQKKRELIQSEGFSFSDDIRPFMELVNEYGESANDLLDAIAVDLSVLETFAVMVRLNKLRTKIVALDYVDSSKVRCDKNLDQYGRVPGYWVSADWTNLRDNPPVYYPAFDPVGNKATTQLFYYRKRALGQPFYPEVSYASALNYVESSHKLSVFLTNTINNGFFSSAIVEINGNEATPEQRERFVENFVNRHAGSENAGKLVFIWTAQPGSVKINPIAASDVTPMLDAARQICLSEICTAHGGNPILVSVMPDGSSLGSDGKLYNTSLQIFYNTVIRQFQKPILSFLERVLDFNGYKEYELEIMSSALLMDEMMRTDLLKPESYISDYGYSVEDLIGYEEEEEKITPEEDGADTDEVAADDSPLQ